MGFNLRLQSDLIRYPLSDHHGTNWSQDRCKPLLFRILKDWHYSPHFV